MKYLSLLLLSGLFFFNSCTSISHSSRHRQAETLPPLVSAKDFTTEELVFYLPEGLEIKAVDYDAEFYADITDGSGLDANEDGRGFIKVHAINPGTKDHYLLIYENTLIHQGPVQIIRFVPQK